MRTVKVKPNYLQFSLPSLNLNMIPSHKRATWIIERCKRDGVRYFQDGGAFILVGSEEIPAMESFWELVHEEMGPEEYVNIPYALPVSDRIEVHIQLDIAMRGSFTFLEKGKPGYSVSLFDNPLSDFPFWDREGLVMASRAIGMQMTDDDVTVLALMGYTVIPLPKFNKPTGYWALPTDMEFDFSHPTWGEKYSSTVRLDPVLWSDYGND